MTNMGSVNNLPWSPATAISNNGEVVGYSASGDFSGPGTEAFTCINGKMTPLGTGAGTGSEAFGVNDEGQVVGSYYTPDGFSYTSTAFLYANGAFIDLNSLLPANSPWDLTEAIGINDAGQIVGIGYLNGNTGQGQNQVFLLDLPSGFGAPTPEPDSLVLLALGVGVLVTGFRARLR
jgi:probable HAF family extracellular repeat protein